MFFTEKVQTTKTASTPLYVRGNNINLKSYLFGGNKYSSLPNVFLIYGKYFKWEQIGGGCIDNHQISDCIDVLREINSLTRITYTNTDIVPATNKDNSTLFHISRNTIAYWCLLGSLCREKVLKSTHWKFLCNFIHFLFWTTFIVIYIMYKIHDLTKNMQQQKVFYFIYSKIKLTLWPLKIFFI